MIYLIVLYIVSTLKSYTWIKNAYSVGGYFHCNSNNAGLIDILFVFTPIVNTVFALISMMYTINGKESSNTSFNFTVNRLFNIKK